MGYSVSPTGIVIINKIMYLGMLIISFVFQVLAALNFFGHGCFQSAVGSSYLNNMSQSSVSRCIKTVTDLILKHVAPKYISFPMTTMQKMETKKQ